MKDLLTLIESALTSAAIVVAGFWGYFLFWRRRQTARRADLSLDLTTASLGGDKRLLHVGLAVLNRGQVLLKVRYAEIRIRQIVPVPSEIASTFEDGIDPIRLGLTELDWPMIVGREWEDESGVLELEPGETDSLHADFVLDGEVEVVVLYAFVRNRPKNGEGPGWTKTHLHTLATGEHDG